MYSFFFSIDCNFISIFYWYYKLSEVFFYITSWLFILTLFDMGFFWTVCHWGGGGGGHKGPYHNFVVFVPMIMKFGTGVKLDVFYTTVTKKFVTSLLLHHYDVITCILADV